jgi:hypothetical protein
MSLENLPAGLPPGRLVTPDPRFSPHWSGGPVCWASQQPLPEPPSSGHGSRRSRTAPGCGPSCSGPAARGNPATLARSTRWTPRRSCCGNGTTWSGTASRACSILSSIGHAGDRPHIALLRANTLFWVLGGRLRPSRYSATRKGSCLSPTGATRQRCCGRRSRSLAVGPGPRWTTLCRSLDAAIPRGRTGLRALTLATGAWAFAGRPEHALAVAERAVPPPGAAVGELPLAGDRLLTALCVAYRLAGRLRQAEALAGRRYRAAVDRGAQELQAPWALLVGESALARGMLRPPSGGCVRPP